MTTYNLTAGNDKIIGTADSDLFDWSNNQGGTDVLRGEGGEDVFILYGGAGSVDGGSGSDTILAVETGIAYLGTFSFSNVETVQAFLTTGSIEQISKFQHFAPFEQTDSKMLAFAFYGEGGSVDFSNKLDAGFSVRAGGVPAADANLGEVPYGILSGYTLTGTAFADWLYGSPFNDVLNGGGGDDDIYLTRNVGGNEWNGFQVESLGTDTVSAGDGDDHIYINSYRDESLNVAATISGIIDGGFDFDTVHSFDLSNMMFKNVEKLSVEGPSISASISQLKAFDVIEAPFSSTSTSTIQFNLRGIGGELDFSGLLAGRALYVDLSNLNSGAVVTATKNSDTFAGSDFGDTFYAGASPDFIYGNDGNDMLDGGSGYDTIDGGSGYDTLIGGDGNDILDGGTNPSNQGDIMLGGPGDDTYYVDSALDLVDEGFIFPDAGWGGTDTIISTANWYWDSQSVGEIDRIAEDADDPNGAGVTFVGGVFDNELHGHSGTDILFGRGGNDIYRAGDGVDWISLSTLGLTDENAYAGVDGQNTVIVDPRSTGKFSYDILFEFESGKDKVDVSAYGSQYASGADVLSHAVDDGAGSSYIALGDGLDYLYFVGLSKAELLAGDFIV